MSEPGIFEIIHSTRAMRRLKPDPIPEATLKKIIDAGIRAPSGGNAQDWAFILVRDPELKRFLRDYYWNTWQTLRSQSSLSSTEGIPPAQIRMYNAASDLAAHLDEAPVILLACVEQEYPPVASLNKRASKLAVYGSIFPAVQNILLSCRALGIGATLTTIHSFFEDTLKQRLSIPASMEVAAMIPMGYPQGKFGPVSRRPVEEVIHWDRWGNQQG